MNATHDSLVKFDQRGRLRYAPQLKAALVETYAASDLSGPKLAALHRVNCQTSLSESGSGSGPPLRLDCRQQ